MTLDLDAIPARHEEIIDMADAGGQNYCNECFQTWPCEAIQLYDELQDIRDSERTILDDKCASDEVHCGCVPTLRKALETEREENRKLRTAVNELGSEIESEYESDTRSAGPYNERS